MYDILIKNGMLVDGSGSVKSRKDLAIKDGQIIRIGDLSGEDAVRIIDASGKTVTPGFIDIHSHADVSVPYYPDMQSCLMQGITTVIAGQCGYAPAPCDQFWPSQFIEMECLYQFSAQPGTIPLMAPADEMAPLIKQRFGTEFDWRSYHEYVKRLKRTGLGANMRAYAGHGAIRTQVLGWDCKRHATDREIAQMQDYLIEAMDAGACGISYGLDYAPGAYASRKELVTLARTARKHGGMLAMHWRRTGIRGAGATRQPRINGIKEALEIATEAEIRLQISHISSGFDIYPAHPAVNACAIQATLDLFEHYQQSGIDAWIDVTPDITGGIACAPDLAMPLLKYMLCVQSREAFVEKLHESSYLDSIRQDIIAGNLYDINPIIDPDWDSNFHITQHENAIFSGKTVAEVSHELQLDPISTYLELVKADPYAQFFKTTRGTTEATVQQLIDYPQAAVGTDSFAVDLTPLFTYAPGMPAHYPHPNTYCGMINFLLKYSQGNFESAVHKITGLPAQMANLHDRGVLSEKKAADIVILDENKLDNNTSCFDPRRYPKGIECVIVNGIIAIENGICTGSRAGTFL